MELIAFLLGIVCVLVLVLVAMRVGYGLGYTDGLRHGFTQGCRFTKQKLTENDGYDSYRNRFENN
jgi:hypothetical protein